MAGLIVLVAAVVLAVGFGLWRRATDGRFGEVADAGSRSTPAETIVAPGGVLAGTPWSADLGERATLVQFSSAFCAPCRSTRVVLSEVAGAVDGVHHVEIDAEKHLDLVRRLGVMRTPTTLVLDAGGREVGRAAGAARKQQVLAAIGEMA